MKNPSVENYRLHNPETRQNPQAKEVFVRVLKNLGNNRYIVSFLGERTELHSKIPLQVGESFKARGFVKNGKPFLEIIDTKPALETISGDRELLKNLGLPNDSLSQLMIAFFKSYGIKINTEHLQKARFLAESFGEDKEEATEIVLFLLNKGIEPSKELISSMLAFFLLRIQKDGEKESVFKATNHIKTSSDHLIILPIEENKEEIGDTGENKGLIKILINTDLHITKKLSVYYKKNRQIFYLMLEYRYGEIKNEASTLQFCIEPALEKTERGRIIQKLEELFSNQKKLQIQYNQSLPQGRLFIFEEINEGFEGWA